MILTCPNCSCQFKVGLAVFGREGRSVKCSACKETWFQEPSLEDVTDEIVEEEVPKDVFESEESSIDEAADEVIAEEDFVRLSQKRVEKYEGEQGQKLAYYIAGGLFFAILAYLLLTSSSMLKAHPSTQSFYRLFGLGLELPDTLSIMFEGVKAEREGTLVTASGRIVNLSRREWALPMIEVVVFRPLVDEDGHKNEEVLSTWVEKPPEPSVAPEVEIPFSFSRHISFGTKDHPDDSGETAEGENKDTYMVRVHFVVMPQQEMDEDHSEEADMHEEVVHDEDNDHGKKGSHDDAEAQDMRSSGH